MFLLTFIFGSDGSSSLLGLFSSCGEWGPLRRGGWASHCSASPAVEHGLWREGSVVWLPLLEPRLSSRRARP